MLVTRDWPQKHLQISSKAWPLLQPQGRKGNSKLICKRRVSSWFKSHLSLHIKLELARSAPGESKRAFRAAFSRKALHPEHSVALTYRLPPAGALSLGGTRGFPNMFLCQKQQRRAHRAGCSLPSVSGRSVVFRRERAELDLDTVAQSSHPSFLHPTLTLYPKPSPHARRNRRTSRIP